MSTGISISGLGPTIAAFGRWQAAVKERVTELLAEAGEETVQICIDTSPVDTGEMRDGYVYKSDSQECIVYNDVEHALYVELGTYKMAAQPTLYPAFLEVRDTFQIKLREI